MGIVVAFCSFVGLFSVVALYFVARLHHEGALSNPMRSWCLALLPLAGFVWLVVEGIVFDQFLGGDPFRGRVDGSRYYLGTGGNQFTEVSEFNWWLSLGVLTSLRATVGILILAAGILEYLASRKKGYRGSSSILD
jgi:hypothetical protein